MWLSVGALRWTPGPVRGYYKWIRVFRCSGLLLLLSSSAMSLAFAAIRRALRQQEAMAANKPKEGTTDPTDLDVPTFLAASVTLLTAAGIAAWLPARRAGRVDAAISLREE